MFDLRSLSAAAATLAFAAAATAQVGPFYTFTQSPGVYTPVTAGTVITSSSATNTLDDVAFNVTLPFSFAYDNAPQTQIWVSTNGWIAFGATSPGATNYAPLSATAATPGFVAACGRDLQSGFVFGADRTSGSNTLTNVSAIGPFNVGDPITGTGIPAGTTITAIAGNTITMSANATTTGVNGSVVAYGPWSDIRTELVGTAPNQEFVVQWSNFRRFSTSLLTNNGTKLNFQIRLKQSGQIQCVYGDCNPGLATVNTTALHQVGLRGPTNAFPANVNGRFNTKGVNDDWSLSAASTANTQGMLFNSVAPANVIPNGLTYEWSPVAGTLATNTTLGAGCVSAYNSFYELFANAAPAATALSGNTLQLIPAGTGYQAVWLPGTASALFVPPVAGTSLATGDDGVVTYNATTGSFPTPQGPQTSFLVSGNAIVAWGGATMDYPGTNSYTPTAGGFLNSTLGGIYAWHDYNVSEVGSGLILAEEIGGTLYLTWNGVESYSNPAGANPSTLQFQLEYATGIAKIVFVSIDGATTSTFSTAHLVGVSSPGASQDPGSISLATASSAQLLTVNPEVLPLAVAATSRPVTGTNWNLSVNNIPATGAIGVSVFGVSDPGINDLFFLGAPGCGLRASLDATSAFIVTGASQPYALAIPNSPTLINFNLYSTAAVFQFPAVNAFGAITANGVQGMIGDL